MTTTPHYDVIVIGGSYAGLSAAMALGRSLRKVLIIDSGKPCNRQTPHSHNFLTQDGQTPAAITQTAKEQVLAYPGVQFVEDLVTTAQQEALGFEVKTESGAVYHSQKLLLAFGIQDRLPDIPGLAACWGISVIHCPYCHGYEVRGKKTGILAQPERAVHLSALVSNLTDQLHVIPSEPGAFSPEERSKLGQNKIRFLDKAIQEIRHENGVMRQVLFTDGTVEEMEALYIDAPFSIPSLALDLGCKLADSGRIYVDQFHQTSAPGVYACGDCTSMMRSVASAVAAGNLTGAMINYALATDV